MAHVLVTGATGTLGPACICELLGSERLVSVLVRASTPYHAAKRLKVPYHCSTFLFFYELKYLMI
jgi:thioester reductase-like protein